MSTYHVGEGDGKGERVRVGGGEREESMLIVAK